MKLNKNILNRVLQESMTDVFNDYIDPSEKIDGVEQEQEETLNDPINHSFEENRLMRFINNSVRQALREEGIHIKKEN